ncbi:MAG: AMIN domain-containing protein [Myxococcaceae bacterium]|nr:AMIN domain-containing protein [Myxococcaceae bacterium]
MVRVVAALVAVLPATAFAQDKVELNRITRVEVKDGAVEITGSRTPTFNTFTMTDPPRLVIDISEAVFAGVPEVIPGQGVITGVKTASYGSASTAIARVLVGFDREVETDLTTHGTTVTVKVLAGTAPPPVAQAGPTESGAQKGTEEEAAQADHAQQRAAEEVAQQAEQARRVQEAAAAEAAKQAEAARRAEQAAAEEAAKQAEQARRQQEAERKKAEEAARQEAERAAEAQRRAEEARQAELEKQRKAAEKAARRAEEERRAQEEAARRAREEAQREEEARKAKLAAEEAAKRAAEERRRQEEEARRAQEAAKKAAAEERQRQLAEERAAKQAAKEERRRQLQAAREAEEAQKRAALEARRAQEKAAREAKARAEEERRRQAAEARRAEGATAGRGKRHTLAFVGFRPLGRGARVTIKTDGPAEYEIREADERTVVVALANTRIGAHNNALFLDTSFFGTPVLRVNPSQAGADVEVEITLAKPVPYQAKQQGDDLVLEFQAR